MYTKLFKLHNQIEADLISGLLQAIKRFFRAPQGIVISIS